MWQPIETANKDADRFFVVSDGFNIWPAHYSYKRGGWIDMNQNCISECCWWWDFGDGQNMPPLTPPAPG